MHANDLFDQITDQLIADIETGATGTWRMPWLILADAGTPANVDGQTVPRHELAVAPHGCRLPRLALRGVGHLPEMATPLRPGPPRRTRHPSRVVEAHQHHARRQRQRRRSGFAPSILARAYAVFAAGQVDGADDVIHARNQLLAGRDTPERIATGEAFFAAVGATVVEGGNRACYQPAADTIHIPNLAQFDHAAHYYGTLAHEHVHWTGHTDRLARDLSGRFGSDGYAAEELVAELGAAMWGAQHGISAVTRPDHAAYLAGWLRVLRTNARALVTVSSKAQAAADHLAALAGHPTTGDIEHEHVA